MSDGNDDNSNNHTLQTESYDSLSSIYLPTWCCGAWHLHIAQGELSINYVT